jgi:hypothetical protein
MSAIVLWTLALIVSASGLIVTVNSHRFARSVREEARELWTATPPGGESGSRLAVQSLPAPVRRYLRLAGADTHPTLRSARLQHGGTMTLSPDAKPVAIRGRQYLAADPPGFVWWGRVRLGPGAWIDARDKVIGGVAGMKVMVESTKTLHDVAGPELDQGALVRLLGEMTWMPTAFLDGRYITWEAMDHSHARARLRTNGREVIAVFEFGADGMPARVTAERHRDLGGGKSVLTPFAGTLADWRDVDGLSVPFRVEGSWIIEGKPFTFARFQVERIEFDRPDPFRS